MIIASRAPERLFHLTEVAENTLLISNTANIEEFCEEPQGAMAQEAQFATWLAKVGRFQSGGELLWLEVGHDRALLFERRFYIDEKPR